MYLVIYSNGVLAEITRSFEKAMDAFMNATSATIYQRDELGCLHAVARK